MLVYCTLYFTQLTHQLLINFALALIQLSSGLFILLQCFGHFPFSPQFISFCSEYFQLSTLISILKRSKTEQFIRQQRSLLLLFGALKRNIGIVSYGAIVVFHFDFVLAFLVIPIFKLIIDRPESESRLLCFGYGFNWLQSSFVYF